MKNEQDVQQGSMVKIRKVELKNILRRLKDIAVRLKDPKGLYDYLERMIENSSELNIIAGLFPFDPEPKNDRSYLFGHFDELHDRISVREGDFHRLTNQFAEITSNNIKTVLKIGITRYNFFCLDEIAKLCFSIKDVEENIQFPSFNVFPVDKIIGSFIVYASEIKKKLEEFFTKEFKLEKLTQQYWEDLILSYKKI